MLLLLAVGALAITYVNAAASIMPVTVGGDAVIKFGPEVKEITVIVGGPLDRKPVVADGHLTELGKEKFGGRAKYSDGTLTITKLKESDMIDFFYRIGMNPMVLTLQAKGVVGA